MAAETLEAQDVSVHFDGLTALRDLSLALRTNEICGLIGPNGAGKTTLVNVLTGFQRPSSGRVTLAGKDVSRLAPEQFARRGVARTFQSVRLFRAFTVLDNLKTYAIGVGCSERESVERAHIVLDWMTLADLADRGADTLSYGMERRVGIARALATHPRFLLLDEPAAGLNDAECDDLMDLVRRIPQRFDCGVMIIEHNMRVVMNVCDRICVIDFGKKIAEGTPARFRPISSCSTPISAPRRFDDARDPGSASLLWQGGRGQGRLA